MWRIKIVYPTQVYWWNECNGLEDTKEMATMYYDRNVWLEAKWELRKKFPGASIRSNFSRIPVD